MNDKTWHKAKELFHEARSLAADERSSFLDERCLNDKELRDQVDEFLGFYDSEFLEASPLVNANKLLENDNFAPGRVIGRYHIRELIGTGGMGQVFLADDTELKRPVAFKVLHEEVAGDKERVRRFIQEARAASALNHPNILTIYEIGSFEGARFIVSEYVDGETLRERMRSGITAAESLEITCQIAAALHAAHAAGIVHRDIKPENIMLRQDGLVKVLDFGLAKLTEADDLPIDASAQLSRLQTSPGLIMGTVAYMSPEQARGQAVDSRTDLWSLGVVFHEMLTGESPFTGESVTDLVASILKHDAASLDLKAISQELKPICTKALAKDKKARYQTAQDLLQDLKGEKKRMEYAIQPTPFITVSSSDELKTLLIRPRPTLSAEYIVSSVKRHKLLTTAIFASVLLIGGVGSSLPWFSFSASDSVVIDPNSLDVTRLTTTGRERWATISPDGKMLAHLNVAPGVKHALLVRPIDAEDDRVLVTGDFVSRAPVFSPDGMYVYYVKMMDTKRSLYRIPTAGGEEFQISDNFQPVHFDISPDGDHIAYAGKNVNVDPPTGALNMSSIKAMISKTDKPVSLTPGGESLNFINLMDGPAFSPDGKRVSMPFEDPNSKKRNIVIYSTTESSSQVVNAEFGAIGHAVWLSNKDLLVSGRRDADDWTNQLWQVGLDGSAKQLTFDLTNYRRISISADRSTVVATEVRIDSNLYIAPATAGGNADMTLVRQITNHSGVRFGWFGMSWTHDKALIFSYAGLGERQLRVVNADGSNNRLFTPMPLHGPEAPMVTPDGKHLLFNAYNDKGEMYLYRYDLAAKVKTALAYAGPAPWFYGFSITPDSKTVIYTFLDPNWPTQRTGGLRQISIDGGEAKDIRVDNTFPMPQISPDGKTIALMDWGGGIGLVPISNPASKVKILDTAPAQVDLSQRFFRWSRDGKAIIYIAVNTPPGINVASENLRRLPIDGSKATNLTNFKDGQAISSFAYSPDGRTLAMARATTNTDVVLVKNLR